MERDPVPAYVSDDIAVDPTDTSIYRPDLVPAFFAAIRSGDVALVTSLLDTSPALAHTPDPKTPGVLPLYAATVAGKPYIVALLAQRGAPIDELSATGEYYDPYRPDKTPIMRTALMAAASQGSLPLVKLLLHDLKADDAVVAPDGAIALRLAVAGGHRDIVRLLPTRRRGGWRRFKHSHRKAMRRIAKAGYALYRFIRFFVWDLPKFFVWDVPKYFLWDLPKEYLPKLGRGLWRGIKALPSLPPIMYKLLKRFVKFMWKGIKGIPRFTIDLAQTIWNIIKKTPGFCLDVLKGCWELTVDLAKWVWKLITQTIPQMLDAIAKFIIRTLAATGRFAVQFLQDVASFFYTLVMAIVTRLRAVTLNDVMHALSIVFVSIPKWVWNTIVDILKGIRDGIFWTLRQMGNFVECLVLVVWEVMLWIPKKLGEIVLGVGEICTAGARETIRWINPKTSI